MFQPVALETLGPINESAIRLVEDLGRRISAVFCKARKGVFLFQRLSVLMQRFNAILVRDSFCTSDTLDLWSSQYFLTFSLVFNPRDLYYRGYKIILARLTL